MKFFIRTNMSSNSSNRSQGHISIDSYTVIKPIELLDSEVKGQYSEKFLH